MISRIFVVILCSPDTNIHLRRFRLMCYLFVITSSQIRLLRAINYIYSPIQFWCPTYTTDADYLLRRTIISAWLRQILHVYDDGRPTNKTDSLNQLNYSEKSIFTRLLSIL